MDGRILKRIIKLRKNAGLTQLDLAHKLNVSHQAISKWERGENLPSIEVFVELSKIYNTSLDYMLMGKRNINVDLDFTLEYLKPKQVSELVKAMFDKGIFWDTSQVIEYIIPEQMVELFKYSIDKGQNFDLNKALEYVVPEDLPEIIKLVVNK